AATGVNALVDDQVFAKKKPTQDPSPSRFELDQKLVMGFLEQRALRIYKQC
ncbi:hypothetical protein PC129_g23855, partial [Phytophthora cactorum]